MARDCHRLIVFIVCLAVVAGCSQSKDAELARAQAEAEAARADLEALKAAQFVPQPAEPVAEKPQPSEPAEVKPQPAESEPTPVSASSTPSAPTTPPPGPVVFEHTLIKPGMQRVLNFVFGQYGSQPKLEAGVGLKMTGGHTAPAVWAKQYLGEKYRVEYEMKLGNEHAWAVCILNGPGSGNSFEAGYGCRIDQRDVRLLRDGKEEETIEKPQDGGEWARIRADVDGGNIEVMLDGVTVAATEDPQPLTGPANGWFGLVGREVIFRNLKIWSPEADTNRERQLTPPETEKPAPNGELLYELKLAGPLGDEWSKTQPQNANVKDGALVLFGFNGAPEVILKNPLTPELACEVEFEYPDTEAVNFSTTLLFGENVPESVNDYVGWRVGLPNNDGKSVIAWHRKADAGDGVWKNAAVLASTAYYAPIVQRKYLVRLETHGDELRVFLDGGLLLKAKRPADAPSTPAFFGMRQIYGGAKVHAARIYKITG